MKATLISLKIRDHFSNDEWSIVFWFLGFETSFSSIP